MSNDRYRKGKAAAIDLAIQWQMEAADKSYSYGELAIIQNKFEKLGKRYGLLKEFRENGIC